MNQQDLIKPITILILNYIVYLYGNNSSKIYHESIFK